ncbi:MAG TPA: GatB/YqeY domain-containing protein [Gemmatimonadales bacterium]|nr:GatB/YqeY domain-containing protein [Gemmatimonadales bacterium]
MRRAARAGARAPRNVASLPERLRAAMNEARKRRDQARTLLLSTILADLKNREFELQHSPSDDEAAEVLRRGIKRRREAAEQYTAGGRADRAAVELAEVTQLEGFLPAAVDPEEIRQAARAAIAAGARDLGKVMGQVMPQFKGRADGKVVNQIVREELAAAS